MVDQLLRDSRNAFVLAYDRLYRHARHKPDVAPVLEVLQNGIDAITEHFGDAEQGWRYGTHPIPPVIKHLLEEGSERRGER